jgi:hypothetical protein
MRSPSFSRGVAGRAAALGLWRPAGAVAVLAAGVEMQHVLGRGAEVFAQLMLDHSLSRPALFPGRRQFGAGVPRRARAEAAGREFNSSTGGDCG